MAFDQGLAEIFRNDLADQVGITEKRMFGGLCFMLHGNMLCGVHSGGGMLRVGKEHEAEALQVVGVEPMAFTGRPMGGMVDVDEEVMADDTRRLFVLQLALEFVKSLPPK